MFQIESVLLIIVRMLLIIAEMLLIIAVMLLIIEPESQTGAGAWRGPQVRETIGRRKRSDTYGT